MRKVNASTKDSAKAHKVQKESSIGENKWGRGTRKIYKIGRKNAEAWGYGLNIRYFVEVTIYYNQICKKIEDTGSNVLRRVGFLKFKNVKNMQLNHWALESR